MAPSVFCAGYLLHFRITFFCVCVLVTLQARSHRCLMCRHQFTPRFPSEDTNRKSSRISPVLDSVSKIAPYFGLTAFFFHRPPLKKKRRNVKFALICPEPRQQMNRPEMFLMFGRSHRNEHAFTLNLPCRLLVAFLRLTQTDRRYPPGFRVNQGHWRGSHGACEHVVGIMQR